jgi:hypothetical protein
MNNLSIDEKLLAWLELRKLVETSLNPLEVVTEFWTPVTTTYHNPAIDPYYQSSWPTPWEIIAQNRYDDFTKALMMGYSLLLTERFKNSNIQINTFVDDISNRLYNVLMVDESWVLNYIDGLVANATSVRLPFKVENIVKLKWPR